MESEERARLLSGPVTHLSPDEYYAEKIAHAIEILQ